MCIDWFFKPVLHFNFIEVEGNSPVELFAYLVIICVPNYIRTYTGNSIDASKVLLLCVE